MVGEESFNNLKSSECILKVFMKFSNIFFLVTSAQTDSEHYYVSTEDCLYKECHLTQCLELDTHGDLKKTGIKQDYISYKHIVLGLDILDDKDFELS